MYTQYGQKLIHYVKKYIYDLFISYYMNIFHDVNNHITQDDTSMSTYTYNVSADDNDIWSREKSKTCA